MRPACTDKDYFYTHTACDANGEVGSMILGSLCPFPGLYTFGVPAVTDAGTRKKTPQISAVTLLPVGGKMR